MNLITRILRQLQESVVTVLQNRRLNLPPAQVSVFQNNRVGAEVTRLQIKV
jgi:hypothetical protein